MIVMCTCRQNSIVDELRDTDFVEGDLAVNFQRVYISGEDNSGVNI